MYLIHHSNLISLTWYLYYTPFFLILVPLKYRPKFFWSKFFDRLQWNFWHLENFNLNIPKIPILERIESRLKKECTTRASLCVPNSKQMFKVDIFWSYIRIIYQLTTIFAYTSCFTFYSVCEEFVTILEIRNESCLTAAKEFPLKFSSPWRWWWRRMLGKRTKESRFLRWNSNFFTLPFKHHCLRIEY